MTNRGTGAGTGSTAAAVGSSSGIDGMAGEKTSTFFATGVANPAFLSGSGSLSVWQPQVGQCYFF